MPEQAASPVLGLAQHVITTALSEAIQGEPVTDIYKPEGLAVLALNALRRAGIPPCDIAVERTRQPMRDHPVWMNFPDHMKGWEAFGVVGPGHDGVVVRRLGVGYDGKGDPGTEPWGPGEVKLGVAAIEWGTFADSTEGGFLHVVGTTEEDVSARWHAAAAAFSAALPSVWPKSRADLNHKLGTIAAAPAPATPGEASEGSAR